jgi:mevalonate kinase
MAKISAKNNTFLKGVRDKTTAKVYSLLVELVNEDRNDLAEIVLKVDYLIDYANTCTKQKDFNEAKEVLIKAKSRIDLLKDEGVNTEYLDFIYEGIARKAKLI